MLNASDHHGFGASIYLRFIDTRKGCPVKGTMIDIDSKQFFLSQNFLVPVISRLLGPYYIILHISYRQDAHTSPGSPYYPSIIKASLPQGSLLSAGTLGYN
jgi:hypothetical protein